jgi:hypothetical protein
MHTVSATFLSALLFLGSSAVAIADEVEVIQVVVAVTTSSVPDDLESVEGKHNLEPTSFATQRASGSIQVVRCESFRNSDLKLDRFQGNRAHPVIVFETIDRFTTPEWFSVPARQCSADRGCESLPAAEIQFDLKASRDWILRWHIGGRYRVILPDGRKEQGDFKVKYLKRDPSVICM